MTKVRKKIYKRRISRSFGGDMVMVLVLTVFGLFMAMPFVYAIMQSLKPMEEIFAFPPRFFVMHPTLENYYMLTQAIGGTWVPVGRYALNSIIVLIISTAGHIIIAAMGAFPLAKMRFKGNRAISNFITYSLLFTAPVTAFPQYIIMAKCGMINTYYALILPSLAAPIGIFLLKNFMVQIPDSLLEAARIDGATNFQMLWKIAVPNVRPAILTLLIFTTQSVWNGANTGFIYSEQLKTLPTMLNQLAASGMARAGVAAAVAVVVMLVPIAIFIVSQSRIIETMAYSGIKE